MPRNLWHIIQYIYVNSYNIIMSVHCRVYYKYDYYNLFDKLIKLWYLENYPLFFVSNLKINLASIWYHAIDLDIAARRSTWSCNDTMCNTYLWYHSLMQFWYQHKTTSSWILWLFPESLCKWWSCISDHVIWSCRLDERVVKQSFISLKNLDSIQSDILLDFQEKSPTKPIESPFFDLSVAIKGVGKFQMVLNSC